MSLANAALRASIVLVPSYTVAYLTEKMVYVVPTLAAAGFFAAATDVSQVRWRRRVDDDGGDDGGDLHDPHNFKSNDGDH